jgi:phenylalanyl-tRNA synthetase beta chain
MPVIGIPVDMLLERIESKLDRDELVTQLQYLGCDVEGYATLQRFRCSRCDNILEITETENPPVLCDRCGADFREQEQLREELGQSDVIRMELLAVRPDMFDPGGLARVLSRYLSEKNQPAHYELAPPQLSVTVAPEMNSDACFRPSIACAVIRDITLDDDIIKVIMKLQENLHWALGRDRKHASIGVYDLDTVKGPGFAYRSVGPEELRFSPLGHTLGDEAAKLTPKGVLEEHPKGKAYARLLETFERYPLLCDDEGQVLSMPPIINSEDTRVKKTTRNFFIDVTGTGDRIVERTLNILVTSFLELDKSAKAEQVTIVYPDRERVTPDLTPQEVTIDPAHVARTIGVELTVEQVMGHLAQMGHRAEQVTDGVRVEVPAYRNDIMHPIDLVEDVAIAYGYHNIEPSLVPTMTVGVEQPSEARANVCRRTLCGLGYFEVMTLILSSEEIQYDAMRLPRSPECVVIEYPISVEQTIIRTSLLPGLLDTFAVNADHPMPQRIFEVGNVSLLAPKSETGAQELGRVAAAAIGPKVDYSELRSTCEAFLRELGWQLEVQAADIGAFIPGRGANIFAKRDGERHQLGIIGELHPEVLERFKLVQPASVFEIDLSRLG